MTNKISVLLLILLSYFFVTYYLHNFYNEGMCTIEDLDDDVTVYYGEFGSVRVRTNSDGDKIIIGVTKNESYNTDSTTVTLHGPDQESITVYKNENGEYLIVDNDTVDDTEYGDTMVYYGNNGSVTVKTNNDGSKSIIDYNTSYDSNSTSINTYYGPNGNSVDIIKTPDGNIKIVGDNKTSGETVYVNTKNNFIRKTEIVPPVCPVCPSITSCQNVNNETNTITGPKGGTVTQGENGGLLIEGSQGGTAVIGPDGNAAAQGPDGGLAVRGSEGNVAVRGSEGNVALSGSEGTIIRGPQGTTLARNGKVGMYLGDNSLVNTPMPILNNFSTFGR